MAIKVQSARYNSKDLDNISKLDGLENIFVKHSYSDVFQYFHFWPHTALQSKQLQD